MSWAPPPATIPAPYAPVRAPTNFAPAWRRFLADLIDFGILVAAMALPTGLLIGWFYSQSSVGSTADSMSIIVFFVLAIIFLPGIWCVVLSVHEGRSGRTPGRWVVKTMAVDVNSGEPIGFARAFARRFCVQYPGILFFLVAYPWMIWDDKHQTLYDKMFETVVIMDPARQPAVSR
jgi:uncharacterized RDD family membrane protein YckC